MLKISPFSGSTLGCAEKPFLIKSKLLKPLSINVPSSTKYGKPPSYKANNYLFPLIRNILVFAAFVF